MIFDDKIRTLFSRRAYGVGRAVSLVIVGAFLLSIGLSCAGGEKDKTVPSGDTRFKDWKTYVWERVKIIYPPGHPQEPVFQSVAAGYIKARDQISATLGMSAPTDTIIVIYYSGYGQGQEMTGAPYPFARNDTINFWLPSFFGTTFMQWMLPRWSPQETRFEFLKHGLISLFDYSGQDYHGATVGYLEAGKLISLQDLATDTVVNSDTERYQSGEAASFVAYILSQYGPATLKAMYVTQLPFDRFVHDSLGMTVEQLQEQWLAFAQANISEQARRAIDSLRQAQQ